MLPWLLRLLFRRVARLPSDAEAVAMLEWWLGVARGSGMPRGLSWVSAHRTGAPHLASPWLFIPCEVQFRAEADGPLSDVPQAEIPRPVIAVFRDRNGTWVPTGRALFNLTVEQAAERLGVNTPAKSSDSPPSVS
jgi:hypothetical protein